MLTTLQSNVPYVFWAFTRLSNFMAAAAASPTDHGGVPVPWRRAGSGRASWSLCACVRWTGVQATSLCLYVPFATIEYVYMHVWPCSMQSTASMYICPAASYAFTTSPDCSVRTRWAGSFLSACEKYEVRRKKSWWSVHPIPVECNST